MKDIFNNEFAHVIKDKELTQKPDSPKKTLEDRIQKLEQDLAELREDLMVPKREDRQHPMG